MTDQDIQRNQLLQAIAALEGQRAVLGDAVIEASLAALRRQLAEIEPAVQPEQQRKLATILFMDIAGHTALTRELDPEENMEVIDQALVRLAEPVAQFGGHIARYQGDGFKAVFGLPIAHENDPDRAVQAGLAILDSARLLAGELEQQRGLSGFNVRIGIDTGLVFSGGVTEGKDTVKGTPVNLAARLESSAQPGMVLISQNTYQHIRGAFDLQPLEPIAAKGFEKPVSVYQVIAAKPRSFRTRRRGVEGVDTRMIGREAELLRLQKTYQDVIEECSHRFVTIYGETGLGKSRLLYEFESWVDLRPERVQFFRGRARQETHSLPYGLLRDLFTFHFAIHDNDLLQSVQGKLIEGFSEIFGPGSQTERQAILVGTLLGYDFRGISSLHPMLDDPGELQQKALLAMSEFFRMGVIQKPAVFLFEDLHWADDRSLDAIIQINKSLTGLPVLMLGAARPDFLQRRPNWFEGLDFHSRLDLAPLSKRDSRQLVEEVLKKIDDLPDEVSDLIVSNAEGNPFYVEELVKVFIDEGAIQKSQDRWQINKEKITEAHIPATLTGVLQARLDSLTETERRTLQAASVVGRIFWDKALDFLHPSREDPPGTNLLAQCLSRLRAREMIYQREDSSFGSAKEYIFKHAMLWEVTYESVPKKLRRAYHQQIADWLVVQEQEIGRQNEYAVVIAEHYLNAENILSAADWLIRAGERVRVQGATFEARDQFEKALRILPESERDRQWQALKGRTDVLGVLGDPKANRKAIDELLALARELENESYLAEAYFRLGSFLAANGDDRGAVKELETSIAAARRIEDNRQEARGLALLVISKTRLGELAEAKEIAESAIASALKGGDDRIKDRVFTNTAVFFTEYGDYARAIQLTQQALEIDQKIGEAASEFVTRSNLGYSFVQLGMFDAGCVELEKSIKTAEKAGARRNLAYSRLNLGLAYLRSSNYPLACQMVDRAIQELEEVGDEFGQAAGLSYLALAQEGLGEITQALHHFQQAQEIHDRIGIIAYAQDARAGVVRCTLAVGTLESAKQQANQLWDYLTQHSSRGMEFPILAYLTCAEVFQAAGEANRYQAALEVGYRDLMERAEKISDPEWRDSYLLNIPEHIKTIRLHEMMESAPLNRPDGLADSNPESS